MKEALAIKALASLLKWEEPELLGLGLRLQLLARVKYDSYEGYRPGQKFLENLIACLYQLNEGERQVAITFILDRLVFISRAELCHAIETVYPDLVRREIIRCVSGELGIPPHLVASITGQPEFMARLRSTLVVGLSDGARLDMLRRASELSTEQFYPGPEFAPKRLDSLLGKLQETPDMEEATFSEVFLVEDFSGSGYTLIHSDDGEWEGKLIRAAEQITGYTPSHFSPDLRVRVVLYVASESAVLLVRDRLAAAGLDWPLLAVQVVPMEARETNSQLEALCERFFDKDVLFDDHLAKGGAHGHLGFSGAALPVVLHHNTPNNSISLLWADSSNEPNSALKRRAVFPRHSRHR